ncbi:hypothetical protein PIB30_023999, partial [Stylosanthes scabra]|nr:hypothetical protein [Stylosanthes scabra]
TTIGNNNNNNNNPNNNPLQQQLMNNEGGGVAAAPSSSSSWNSRAINNSNNNLRNSVTPIPLHKRSKLEDSDEDLFTVPDVETMLSVHSTMINTNSSNNVDQSNTTEDSQLQAGGVSVSGKRRRGRNPVDKEYRRLKRYITLYMLFI